MVKKNPNCIGSFFLVLNRKRWCREIVQNRIVSTRFYCNAHVALINIYFEIPWSFFHKAGTVHVTR